MRDNRHGLQFEGAPHDEQGHRIGWRGTSGTGRAKCACNWLSEVHVSGAARKQAHRQHKIDVKRDEMYGSTETRNLLIGTWAWQVAVMTNRSPSECLPIVKEEFEARIEKACLPETVIDLVLTATERVLAQARVIPTPKEHWSGPRSSRTPKEHRD